MIRVLYSNQFKKRIRKRLASSLLQKKFQDKLQKFQENQFHPLLRDHNLHGDLEGYRAFSITGDIRIIYREIDKNTVEFLDIGTHAQVYGS